MIAPALTHMRQDLGVIEGVLTQMMLSIFILAYGIGPFILSPMSELYGRTPVLQLSNLVFLVFTIACGFAANGSQMLAFRFFAGLGGSAATSVGGGTIGDCFDADTRGKAVMMYTVGPLVAPAVGPVLGGLISGHTTWRWVFWATAVVDAVVFGLAAIFLRESWAPVLLNRKAVALRAKTGNTTLVAKGANESSLAKKLAGNLSRPLRLLTTQPLVVALALYMGYVYGLNYLVTSTFATLWTERYGQSTSISGLHYLALAIGFVVGSLSSRINTKIYLRLKNSNGGVGRPEFRVAALIASAVLLPIGLCWYGWSAQYRLFWIMPDIGVGILAAAILIAYSGVQTYVIDTYTKYAASAIAAISLFRSLAGFGFPLYVLEYLIILVLCSSADLGNTDSHRHCMWLWTTAGGIAC
jgi:multidrug resistance protein